MKLSDVVINFVDGVGVITILEGEFKDVVFSFGKVWFPEDDSGVLSFEYNTKMETADWSPEKTTKFQQACGQLLEAIIMDQIEKEDLVFKGGV